MVTWIDARLYKKIVEVMPIPTVDAITTYKKKFLLLLRNNSPVKDNWWLPGGRIMRNENFDMAVLRQLYEETDLKGWIKRRVGVINQIFPEVHTISIYYHVEVDDDEVILNEEHREYRWVLEVPENRHPYLRKMVDDTFKILDTEFST
jgi:ADP-ribose pyrophosphatase YjhB (NUDIX family)